MDKLHYEEMKSNLNRLIRENHIQDKRIYLFGHCNATEELAKLLLAKGFSVEAILDNNDAKCGKEFLGIPVQTPRTILADKRGQTVVCIVARAYAEMMNQLRCMGYREPVYKLAEYNSFAE